MRNRETSGVGPAKVVAKNDERAEAESVRLASQGIRTTDDVTKVLAALMADVLLGAIASSAANSAVNASGKMMKAVDMAFKYGNGKALRLVRG